MQRLFIQAPSSMHIMIDVFSKAVTSKNMKEDPLHHCFVAVDEKW